MLIIGIILLVIAFYIFAFYNQIKTLQVRIKASVQEIGNQLKRQADLIPNLVNSAQAYLKHEKSIFEELTSARKSITQAVETGDTKKLDESQDLINRALGSLRVIVESNPELKAAGIVSDLMNELRDTSDKLMYSRRTFIDLTADHNTAIATVPGAWIAGIFGFKEEKGLETPLRGAHIEVSESETTTPQVKLN